MRLISSFAFPLLVLAFLTIAPRPGTAVESTGLGPVPPGAAVESIDQGLLPPGSAADLVLDHGVPQPGDAPIPYVIVTSLALRPTFLELGRARIRNGIRSAVRSLESIQQAYPVATDDADRVRRFLRDAHDAWGTRFALLGGDTDVLPARYVTTPSVLGERHFVSDWYFACLDGTWDADQDGRYAELRDPVTGDPGDAPDAEPELFVGRAPVSTPEEARRFVDKTLAYERRPDDGFEHTTLMFANRLAPFLDLAQAAEVLLPLIADDPAQQVTRLYESFDDPAWVPGALPESPAAVLAALDQGANVTIGFGAGSPDLMEAGPRFGPDPYLTVPEVLGLTNGDRAGHVWLLTSLVNAFDTPTSLGEAFLRARGGGAVTVIAPSDLTLTLQAFELSRRFVEVVFDQGAPTIGEALARARAGLLAGPPLTLLLTYQLLGDPMLRIFSSSPVAEAVGGAGHGRTGITSRSAARDEAQAADALTAIRPPAVAASDARVAAGPAAQGFALALPAPSPCAGAARIACTVPAELAGATLDAAVLDLAGRTVRTLARGSAPAGVTTLVWDLRDDRGARVRPGVYFLRATFVGLSQTRRLVVTSGP